MDRDRRLAGRHRRGLRDHVDELAAARELVRGADVRGDLLRGALAAAVRAPRRTRPGPGGCCGSRRPRRRRSRRRARARAARTRRGSGAGAASAGRGPGASAGRGAAGLRRRLRRRQERRRVAAGHICGHVSSFAQSISRPAEALRVQQAHQLVAVELLPLDHEVRDPLDGLLVLAHERVPRSRTPGRGSAPRARACAGRRAPTRSGRPAWAAPRVRFISCEPIALEALHDPLARLAPRSRRRAAGRELDRVGPMPGGADHRRHAGASRTGGRRRRRSTFSP